jgi:hypothetical protein
MISRALKCVFVHVPKVAGQSVEQVFLDHHGLTWETREALLLRPRKDPSEGPSHLAHLTAREYVERGFLTAQEWDAYFTFSFVRNPWARAVSLYKYLGDHRRMPFSKFVRDRLTGPYVQQRPRYFGPQADFVCDRDGQVIVDLVGRLERIREDFAVVARRVGLPTETLPHQNRSDAAPWSRQNWHGIGRLPHYVVGGLLQRRYERGSYAAYYDEETAERVGAFYARDVALFGYRFEDLTEPARPPAAPERDALAAPHAA